MLPIIGAAATVLPVVSDVIDGISGGDDKGKAGASELGKALEKVADKDPALAKELAFALSETIQEGSKGDDGKMPKELEGLLNGAVDMLAGMIPGGGLVKGLLGKIF